MVRVLSRWFSRVLVAIMAGTLQPNPTSIGINDFPGNPRIRIKRSITNAARAMYPESSSKERKRNIKPMGGIKVAMV